MSDVSIYLSYDVENDADLCDRLLAEAEAGGSGFVVAGQSERGADPDSPRVRRRIADADEVIVLCGEHTEGCEAVARELIIAQEEEKPYFLVWGRRESMCTRPTSAKPDDAMYSWTTPILLSQIEVTLRRASPPDIPESCKRMAPRAKRQA